MPPRPRIAANRDRGTVIRETADAIAAVNVPPFLFRRGGLLARIGRDDFDLPVIVPLGKPALRAQLALLARWVSESRDGDKPCPPDDTAVDGIYSVADMLAGVPVLDQVVTAPVFAADGSLELSPGYSYRTRNWYAPDAGMRLDWVPEQPTRRQAWQAADYLMTEWLGDFPFDGLPSRVRALSLLLLPFCRMMIDGSVPLYAADAATPGTGKTLLQRCCLLPALGEKVPMSAGSLGDEAELRKNVTTQLIRGQQTLIWDNVRASVDSAVLAALVTQRTWQDRMLGANTSAEIAVRAVCLVNGNNLRYSQEMSRRVATSRLVAGVENPERRTGFRHENITGWGLANRGALACAALTVIKAWVHGGMPEGTGTLGSFESWSQVMGGIIEYATGWRGALVHGLDLTYEETSDERASLGTFLAAWWARYGSTPVTTSDIDKLLYEHDPFGLPDNFGRGRETMIGQKLHRIRDQVTDGYQVVKMSRKWHVRRVEPDGSVSA